jgi:hypothetical protein
MKFKQGQSETKIYFLRESDLGLLKSRGLELSDLPTLPRFDNVSDDDCLNWLEYQRGMEKLYSGFVSTTYDPSSGNIHGDFNRKSTLYKAKYEETLKSTKKPSIGKFAYSYHVNEHVFIIHSSNTLNNPTFAEIPGDLSLSVYRALLSILGGHAFYFKNCDNLLDSVKERGYINAGYVLSKVVA